MTLNLGLDISVVCQRLGNNGFRRMNLPDLAVKPLGREQAHLKIVAKVDGSEEGMVGSYV